jgi:Flp pilus assembly protein TadG
LSRPARTERGSAVVDFVLVVLVVLPLFLGILQVALVLHVRNTLTAAASEGARYAATADRTPADGAARTRRQIAGALAARFAQQVSARPASVHGMAGVEVRVAAEVPALGLWGPAVRLLSTGHAVEEVAP